MTEDIIKKEDGNEEIVSPDKFFYELNLLRIEGVCFDFSRYRGKAYQKKTEEEVHAEKIKTPDGEIEAKITVTPGQKHGKPQQLAYKILTAVFKKISAYGYPFSNNVYLGEEEIASLIGRSSYGGRDQAEFYIAIMQIRRTFINCQIQKKIKKDTPEGQKQEYEKDWEELDFSLFTKVHFAGKMKGKKKLVKQCLIQVEENIINNLNNFLTICLNYNRLKNLEPIGVALYKNLFFNFSKLYSKLKTKNFVYAKDYDFICEFWLGGLQPRTHKSFIERDQLGPHLKKLKSSGLIKSYSIDKKADNNGFKLTFKPGQGFFQDFEFFYSKYPQLSLQFEKLSDQKKYEEPLLLVEYFYKKKLKVDKIEDDILPQNDVDYMASLLSKYSYEDVHALIDFSIAKAMETAFDMQTAKAINVYKTEFLTQKEKRKIEKQISQEEDAEIKIYKQLLNEFDKNRQAKISELLTDKISGRQAELEAEFFDSQIKNNSFLRSRYDKEGLDSVTIQSMFETFLAKKFLHEELNSFSLFLNKRGYIHKKSRGREDMAVKDDSIRGTKEININ